MSTPYPARLDVTITRQHLHAARAGDPRRALLALAAADELTALGIPFTHVEAAENSVRIYHSHPVAHDARYGMSDEAWKAAARHAAGRRVTPRTVVLEAVYRKDMAAHDRNRVRSVR